jgi:molybdopterin molybdotransferase
VAHVHHVEPSELVPLERYRRETLGRLGPLDPIELGLIEAHGCVLAVDVAAPDDVPAFANSAMDGFAVAAAAATVDAELDVVGEVAAGASALPTVRPGTAVRIMTGAPLPPGADAVVPVEVADEAAGRVRLRVAPRPGDHVRAAGESVRGGTRVLAAGRRLDAADVGLLAAVGCARVAVRPRPRVAVISTGDELTEPDTPMGPGRIRDSNSYMLTAMAREAGAVAFRHPIVRDDRRALSEAFEGALAHADILVTSGGVSAGRYDLVKEVLAQLGDVAFHKVGMQPGMPQAFGFIAGVPCFGLPGNPVSAYVSFEVFVRPALRRLQGRTDLNRPRVTAVLDDPLASPPHKVSFLRVRLRREGAEWHAQSTGEQGSAILRSVVDADGLAEVPAERTEVPAGERVVVHLLVDAQ